jgi:HrpA-like RNA helicase
LTLNNSSAIGIESLAVVPISKVQAKQRAGRAGRTKPGKCYRLYSQKTLEQDLPEEAIPEIQRTSLAGTVLVLKSMGVEDPLHFDFIDRPSDEQLVLSFLFFSFFFFCFCFCFGFCLFSRSFCVMTFFFS